MRRCRRSKAYDFAMQAERVRFAVFYDFIKRGPRLGVSRGQEAAPTASINNPQPAGIHPLTAGHPIFSGWLANHKKPG